MTVPARRPVDDALDRLKGAWYWDEREGRYISAHSDALAVRGALERLTEERNALREVAKIMLDRAESAEAEVRRLTEGLREIHQLCAEGHGDDLIAQKADALLSANPPQGDAAAGSSPTDGGGA